MAADDSETTIVSAIPAMLPADGGIATAPDATAALSRAVSRHWVRQMAEIPSFDKGQSSILGVSSWRQDALNNQLRKPAEVESWVVQQATHEGRAARWLSGVPLNEDDYDVREDGMTIILRPLAIDWSGACEPNDPFERPGASLRTLDYLTPNGLRSEPVRANGNLDWLRRLSRILAQQYRCAPEQVATWAMTGLIPVFAIWDEQLKAEIRIHGRRPRDLSAKSLELALFTDERRGMSLAARMSEWNGLYPHWAYTQVTNFGRDSLQSVTRFYERLHASTQTLDSLRANIKKSEQTAAEREAAEQRANAAIVEQWRQVHESGGDEDMIAQFASEEPQFLEDAEKRSRRERRNKVAD